ncbi:MAG: restriction endonuclease subunit S [Patescibacteria group bacterium]
MNHQIKTKIPEGWELKTIKEIANVVMGQSPSSVLINENGVGVPFLQGNAEFGASYPQPQKWITKPLKVSTQDSILISVRAPVGELNKSNTMYCIGRGLASINYNIGSDYGWYQTFLIKRHLDRVSQGSTFLAVSKGDIENSLITLPKLPEERLKIADILKNVDLSIEKTEQLIKKYRSIKQGLMQDLFRYGIDENGQIRSEKTHKFKDSPLGRIPKEWEVDTLGNRQITKLVTDGSHFSPTEIENSGYLIATVENMAPNQLDLESCKNISESDYLNLERNNCKPNKGDVLFSKDGTIGRVLVFGYENKNIVLLSSIAIIRTDKNKLLPTFLAHFLKSFLLDKQLLLLTSGSALRRIVLRDINNIKVLLPSIKEQEKMVKSLDSIDNLIRNEITNKNKQFSIKLGLMQDLLTGKVRVNHLLN